jgi:tRNA threonylcarbamoyl adenosine modification protein (Sua5/YciO/YrdC/YwlC family)
MKRVSYDEAVDLLNAGGVVALPTDTVYGVAAALSHADAVRRLFHVKGRPDSVALPVLVADVAMAHSITSEWSLAATALAGAWPGALTMIVPAPNEIAALVGASNSLGVRVPADDELVALLRRTGPLAVTSANRHGHEPATSWEELATAELVDLDAAIDGGVRTATPSTVVDTRSPWRVVRAGGVSREALEALLN